MSKDKANILILDIDDHNTMYVFASKGIQIAYLKLKILQ